MSSNSGDIFIGRGVVFTGTIDAPNSATINGEVTGDLTAKKLIAGNQAVISGTTIAEKIDVSGVLLNKTICKGLLTVFPTGKIHGSTQFEEVEMHPGAVITGAVNK